MTKAKPKVVDNEYPKMLYKGDGSEEMHGGKFDTRIVHDADEEAAALTEGWHLSTPEAAEAAAKAKTGSVKAQPAKAASSPAAAPTVGTPGAWGQEQKG